MNELKREKQNKSMNKGITLIALVITIIVLLILAGVSIAMLTGENGLLTRANDAKKATDIAEVKERAQLDITNWVAERLKNQEDTTLNDTIVKSIIENANKDNTNKYYLELTDTKITTKQGNEILLSDLYNKTSGGNTSSSLAKDVLKTDSAATDAAAKSPYVKYNGLDCRVLYNDDTHGLQIITADSVENVTLGNEDEMVTASDFSYGEGENETVTVDDTFKKAAASYNKAVDNLNKKAKSYMDVKGMATDARCLGSIPTLKDAKFQGDTSEMWSGTEDYLTTYGWNNKFKTTDTNHLEDLKQINDLRLNASTGTWLASRHVTSNSDDTRFNVYCVTSYGYRGGEVLGSFTSYGYASASMSTTYGFRPIFLLPSNLVISSGDGSREKPYIIE